MATSNGPTPAAGLLGGKRVESGTKIYTGVDFTDAWGNLYYASAKDAEGISFGSAFSSLPSVVVSVKGINEGKPAMVMDIIYDSSGIYSISLARPMSTQNATVAISWVAIGS